jgi:DNA-binding MltR family transcriptional regulator
MPSRERWLVEKDGGIIVQTVYSDAQHGYMVPTVVEHQERTYQFAEVSEGVEVYVELE